MGHDNERRQPRPRRKFSDEFKRDAVDLVLTTGRPIAEVAAELGIYDSTLGNWVRRHQDEQAAGSLSPNERARLKELEAENAKLRVERDLLRCEWRPGSRFCAPRDGRPSGRLGGAAAGQAAGVSSTS